MEPRTEFYVSSSAAQATPLFPPLPCFRKTDYRYMPAEDLESITWTFRVDVEVPLDESRYRSENGDKSSFAIIRWCFKV